MQYKLENDIGQLAVAAEVGDVYGPSCQDLKLSFQRWRTDGSLHRARLSVIDYQFHLVHEHPGNTLLHISKPIASLLCPSKRELVWTCQALGTGKHWGELLLMNGKSHSSSE